MYKLASASYVYFQALSLHLYLCWISSFSCSSIFMAHQSLRHPLRDDDDSMDPHMFLESFIQASSDENKRLEFELKHSPSQIPALVRKAMEDLALSSSASSSTFQFLKQPITRLASRHGGSEQDMPQLWKDLITMISSDPQVASQPAEKSLGSKLEELESDGAHKEQTQDLNPSAIVNSNYAHNLSAATSLTNNSSNSVTPLNLSVSSEISAQPVNPVGPNVTFMPSDSHTINMPVTPSESPPHEDNNLGFTVFAVELLGALTNLAVSSKPDHNQVLIYVVVACSTLAFSISSTAIVLRKKRPRIAKKMQEAAFLIGTFGFMGIMGMLLPSTITWCFTISAFLVFVLMFALATSSSSLMVAFLLCDTQTQTR